MYNKAFSFRYFFDELLCRITFVQVLMLELKKKIKTLYEIRYQSHCANNNMFFCYSYYQQQDNTIN